MLLAALVLAAGNEDGEVHPWYSELCGVGDDARPECCYADAPLDCFPFHDPAFSERYCCSRATGNDRGCWAKACDDDHATQQGRECDGRQEKSV